MKLPDSILTEGVIPVGGKVPDSKDKKKKGKAKDVFINNASSNNEQD